jgi:lipopolysaccharide exporter
MDINDLAVGKIMGFHSVAIASRAQGLMNLFHRDFMTAVRNVAFPAFSRAHRGGESVEEKFRGIVGNVTAVAWPFYGFAALFPLEVLRLMFGPQWDSSAPLVPWFCMAGALSATVNLIPPVMMSTGESRLVATAELLIQPFKAVSLCLVVYFYRDLLMFSMAFMVVALVQVPFFYWMKQRCLPTDFGRLGRIVGKNLLLAAVTLLPASLAVLLLRIPGKAFALPWFFACVAVTALSWLLAMVALRHPLYRELQGMLRSRFPNIALFQ